MRFIIEFSDYIYIYAFSRRFYPKRITVHSGYTFFVSMCVPWECHRPAQFSLNNICAIKSMILLEMKIPQLSMPEATAARNQNSIGDRMEKKPCEKGSLLFYEYHEFGHTAQLTYCFSPAI